MQNRRHFIKTGAVVGIISSVSACTSLFNDKASIVKKSSQSEVIIKEPLQYPLGIIYTKQNPGKWANKVGGHLPKVTVEGRKITILTDHGMSTKHYIVRHTVVDVKGNVLATHTFTPDDDEALSIFDITTEETELFATSFCNKHDFWLTSFTL
jgi:superoxide reductase